jgi:uncharacterized 2Fe-2S/4Fe-4S cluster protein (DUF4445 family)
VFPYTPQFVAEQFIRAGSIGFRFNPDLQIQTLPLITGFIGADIVSAALASDLSQAAPGTMLVDVGTNGEIMCLGRNGLSATSCATGPAFEGAAISHGMHAVSGAIDAVQIDKNSGQTVCSLIQQNPAKPKKPAGLCGTGVISTVAELHKAGFILNDGAFNYQADIPNLQLDEDQPAAYILVPAENTQDGRAVTFTQNDVRAIQLAKGALRTGIDLLCREEGLETPAKLLVAGAFGSFINKIDALRQELDSYIVQNRVTRQMVSDSDRLLRAEIRKFQVGESSLFLVNTREAKLIESQLKAIKLQNKFFETKAKLFNSIAINPNF